MAPTLMGRHKEITCKQCGWTFTVGATEEMEHTAPLARCVCPNCRFLNDVQNEPAFKGDRILVLKALYDLPDWVPDRLREPHRWDVVVFKFPEEPQVNYIKRLVALPGEEPCIQYGNFFTRTDKSAEFQIARKPPHKQKVLRMLVYDNNHQPKNLPESWARWTSDTAAGPGWKTSDGRRFETPPASNSGGDDLRSSARLAYRHLSRSWDSTQDVTTPPPPQLITDFYGYNSGSTDGRYRYGDTDQSPHWVGDLTLSLQARVSEARGKLRVELVEAGEHFICEFDFESGACRLYGPQWRSTAPGQSVGDKSEFRLAEAQDVITRPGKYKIEFANVDDRLTVWVDGKLPFGDGYDYAGPRLGESQVPTADDLQPAAIESRGASVAVSDLVLYRD
ncbi:MAG: signal peptidase I, partial [Planctomycetes bacterium]|nr:signal peptidase I [Planctomycetota bacterium]